MAIIGTNDTATVRVATPPVGVTYQNIGDAATLNGVAASNYARTDVASVPFGGAIVSSGESPQIQGGNWAWVSSSDNGYALFSNNLAQLKASPFSYRAIKTHPSIGYAAIRMVGNALIEITQYSGATTAGATVTPTWHRIWHAGNDGAGSGLDADLLDGVQGSNYARTDIAETFNSNVTINFDNVNALTLNKTNDSSLCGITFTVGGLSNWMLYTSNAGNGNIALQSRNYTADGGVRAVIWEIDWAGGVQTFVQTPTVGGNTIWHAGNDVRHRSFTVGTVPSASSSGAGTMIYVSNESGGAVPAFSDGTNWRRVTDRAIIS